jgi:hypothetical protein
MLANNKNDNALAHIAQQARQFRDTFKGNPQQEVQRLLNSGQMTQEQFNSYAQIAQQVASFMSNK